MRAKRPLGARVFFATSDGAELQEAKWSMVQLQAQTLIEIHPSVAFEALSTVIVTDDVWETVGELERQVGREVEAARNGARHMPVFSVDIGEEFCLVVRNSVADLLLLPSHAESRRAMEVLRIELARIKVLSDLRRRIGGDPRLVAMDEMRSAWFGRSRDTWHSYASARLAYAEGLSTDDAIAHFVKSLEEESQALLFAIEQFKRNRDVLTLASDLQDAVGRLSNSMACAMGQITASGKALDDWWPGLTTHIEEEGLGTYWRPLATTLESFWEKQEGWTVANDLVELGRLFLAFLASLGLTFEANASGGYTVSFVPSRPQRLQ